MPAASPEQSVSELIIQTTIKINGSPIKDTYGVISVNIYHEVNKISYCEVVLTGDTEDNITYPITGDSSFNPGNDIEVTIGFGTSDSASVFTGIIVKHSLDISPNTAFNVRLSCKHKAIGMTFNRTESEFANQTDSAAISSIFGNYGSLSATVDATSPVQENIFQKLGTDWDFIMSRAEFFGYIVTMDGDSIFVGKPKLDSSAVLRIAYGESIFSFSAELNAEKQVSSIEASAWDIKTQALIKETASEPSLNAQGNVTAKSLSSKINSNKLGLMSSAPLPSEELKAWADSSLLRMRLSAIRGQVTIVGSGIVKTGNIIDLEGVGDKFNGSAFVSAVQHIVEGGQWKTKIKFGLDSKFIYEKSNFAYPSALGQLPPVNGLHVGTVQKISEDPQSLYRVLVNIPSGSQTQTGFWARLAGYYATSGAGSFFYPEVGDEVIVGFVENDPRYPIVLGSMYSSKLKSPIEPADNNNYQKAIITKAQLKITFDDEKKITVIQTPAGNKITLSDDAKSIEITDQNSNSIKMTSSGIDINSSKDINISGQNINISGKAKIALSAQADVTAEGMNVNLTAKVGFAGKGTTAEINGTGQTTIKGAMVMIN